jgi:lysophospholipase L1-like esterase
MSIEGREKTDFNNVIRNQRINMGKNKRGRYFMPLASLLFGIIFAIAIGETFLYFFFPQKYMYPNYEYSREYGHMLFPDTTMVHACPQKWRFEYTINQGRYRGKYVPILSSYEKKNIIFLGDSNTFGYGVNDGEEYPAVIKDLLKDHCDIINLAVGGWGLTQQIRRFYEFGKLYRPSVVVLQFCGNDLGDNIIDPVATIENKQFVFSDTTNTIHHKIAFLSKSILQRSQIYNLFKNAFFNKLHRAIIKKGLPHYYNNKLHAVILKGEVSQDDGYLNVYNKIDRTSSEAEDYYIALLDLFARDLHKNGIKLIFISLNNDLEWFPKIKQTVMDLHREKMLFYYETSDWFHGVKDYGTPEGHAWGVKGHRIVGEKLARIIKERYL